MEPEYYMREALKEAQAARAAGEVPVGCVVVSPGGTIIGRGHNRCEVDKDPTAHAEVLAIREAARKLGDWRMGGCSLFVTLEPCPMCAGAILNARISHLYYGAREPVSGSCGSILNLFMESYGFSPAIRGGILEEDCAREMKEFFVRRRSEPEKIVFPGEKEEEAPRREKRGEKTPMPFIELKDVRKEYIMGEVRIQALREATFTIDKGEICVIVGPSGAGKTTLLNILGGMDALTEGRVVIDGEDISHYNAKQLTMYRRRDVGFVFQFYNLVQNLTALENVELANQICADPLDAAQVLREVGLGERLHNFPAQLSGGEQQRVAIARALAKNPKLLLCDEPTGALDYTTGKSILKLLQDTARSRQMTVVLITHNSALTAMADRVVRIHSGTVASVEINDRPTPVEEIEW